ncbi:hypothetical protein IM538_02895 [Cytobacillus suaedae]|nr:hypothetical protein IM538_02895 [Cytobacillus suaedae]
MKKHWTEKSELELDEDLDEELQELLNKFEYELDDYDVEYPNEAELMKTIDTLRPYVPTKINKWETFVTRTSTIAKQALTEVYYMSPLFWIANVVFIMIALTAVSLTKQNPYTVLFFLAPIPTMTGLIEVLKSRNAGMSELELSFKFNLQEVILSKMVVVGVFNLLINIVITFIMSLVIQDVLVWELMLYWIAPFTVITSIALTIVTRFRKTNTVTIGLILWIAMGNLLSRIFVLESVPEIFYMIITVIAAVAIVFQIKTIYRRGISHEFNH